MRSRNGAVLVVASEPTFGERVCAALQRLGLTSVLAPTAVEAVHRLADDAPAAIVVDLDFADMDPRQIVHRALACRETHGSPVLVLAPVGEDHDRESLLDSGCAAVLDRATEPLEVARAILAQIGTCRNAP